MARYLPRSGTGHAVSTPDFEVPDAVANVLTTRMVSGSCLPKVVRTTRPGSYIHDQFSTLRGPEISKKQKHKGRRLMVKYRTRTLNLFESSILLHCLTKLGNRVRYTPYGNHLVESRSTVTVYDLL